MKAICIGSNTHVGLSPGQIFYTAGYVRANQARGVSCPDCNRVFDSTRISYTDHGIPTPPQALIPRHAAK